jgi:hypothetical protein
MNRNLRLGFLLLVALLVTANASAQTRPSAAETVERLKLRLIEVQAKEDSLRNRLQRLDYDLQPENIERSLAGIGSTKPEELREHRRRQLSIERDGVLAQLQRLATDRARLESAIASAEGRAYQESALPWYGDAQSGSEGSTGVDATDQGTPVTQMIISEYLRPSPAKIAIGVLFMAVLTGALITLLRRS